MFLSDLVLPHSPLHGSPYSSVNVRVCSHFRAFHLLWPLTSAWTTPNTPASVCVSPSSLGLCSGGIFSASPFLVPLFKGESYPTFSARTSYLLFHFILLQSTHQHTIDFIFHLLPLKCKFYEGRNAFSLLYSS